MGSILAHDPNYFGKFQCAIFESDSKKTTLNQTNSPFSKPDDFSVDSLKILRESCSRAYSL